ncbi:DUF2117 domain-containing protein [uncultured Methanobrevibacter sp.]|uniref:DUF2117 domain-containing protein n=1 Tax=uncultured Methanobrevibacter sp. TaxID=253161 RepID=UPI0026262B87|nr:DUF2117 domain-containing protein [uncultured Methanobrevibacter sp.]
MKIGVVVHGPNIIDSGWALKLINLLSDYGDVSARLGGTMGRTAVIDNSLEDVIDISKKLVPSDSLKLFHDLNVDVIFLVNYGKSHVTGQVFGYKVYNHYLSKVDDNNIPIIQIERPGEDNGSIISWNGNTKHLISDLASKLNLNIVTPEEVYINHFKNDEVSDGNVQRIVHGVSPSENIMVNGIIIGKSDSDELVLIAKEGYIVDIIGGTIKKQGVEKLGKIDLENAIIKTGLLRKSKAVPRILEKKVSQDRFKVGFLDSAMDDVHQFKNMDLVITVGNDVTVMASDILYRFKVPIIGITNGDLDKIVENAFKSKNSIIFEFENGFGDIIGQKIFELIFNNKRVLIKSKNSKNIDEIKKEIIKITKLLNCKYNIINI